MNKLVVRSFLGKQHLSLPPTGSTIDEIDDLENVTDDNAPLDDEEEHLAAITVTGIQQLESLHTCINCKKTIHPTKSTTGVCNTCNTMQRMSNPKLTAKLFIET